MNTSKRLAKENESLRGWQRTAGVRSFLTLFDVASVFSFSQAAQKRDVDTLVSVARSKVVSPGSRNPRLRTHSDTHTWSTHITHGDGLIDGVAGKPRFHRHRSRLRCPTFACRLTDTETPIRSQNVRPWSKIHLLHRPTLSCARQASRAMSCNESTAVCALHLPCPPTTELGLRHLFVQHHFYDKEIPSREIGSIEHMLGGFRFNEMAKSFESQFRISCFRRRKLELCSGLKSLTRPNGRLLCSSFCQDCQVESQKTESADLPSSK